MGAEIHDFESARATRGQSPFTAYFSEMSKFGMQMAMLPWVFATHTQKMMESAFILQTSAMFSVWENMAQTKGMKIDRNFLDVCTGYPNFSRFLQEPGNHVLARAVPYGEGNKDVPELGNYLEAHLDVEESGGAFSFYEGNRAGDGIRAYFKPVGPDGQDVLLYKMSTVTDFHQDVSLVGTNKLTDVAYITEFLSSALRTLNARTLQRSPGAFRQKDKPFPEEGAQVVVLAQQ